MACTPTNSPIESTALIIPAHPDTLADIPTGVFRLCVDLPSGKVVDIGRLRVWPRGAGDMSPGQWFLAFDQHSLAATGLEPKGWTFLLSRLGLHPLRFSPAFRTEILSTQPVAVVFDTSAVYAGVLTQLLCLRKNRPTYFAVPDQTFMELQYQRERKPERQARVHRLASLFTYVPYRAMRRARNSAHVVHFVRPPEPMVRYFGSAKGTASDDEAVAGLTYGELGPSYHRDRLILEAARDLRRSLPEIPLWIATADKNLALQSEMEQFHPALCWVPDLPDPVRYTSPLLCPYTLLLHHVDVSALLAEIVWTLGGVSLQSVDAAEARQWRLPGDDLGRTLLLLQSDRLIHPVTVRRTRIARVAASSTTTEPPQKAPPPQTVVEALVRVFKRDSAAGMSPVVGQYLQALGWATGAFPEVVLTEAGIERAKAWLALRPTDIDAWCDWFRLTSADLSRLPVLGILVNAMTPGVAATNQSLVKVSRLSGRTVESQVVLGGAFGLFVRVSGKTWLPAPSPELDEGSVLQEVRRRLLEQAGVSSMVETATVFTGLLRTRPLPIHRFRRALAMLVRGGKVLTGGSTQPARRTDGRSPVRIRLLLPDAGGLVVAKELDLRSGDFLLGEEPCQVVGLAEGT